MTETAPERLGFWWIADYPAELPSVFRILHRALEDVLSGADRLR